MRDRYKIEDEMESDLSLTTAETWKQTKLLLEVLLDIRELLKQRKRGVR